MSILIILLWISIVIKCEEIPLSNITTNDKIVVKYMERTIFISHMPAIYIEENIFVKNEGYTMKGPYEPSFPRPSNWWQTYLPASAQNVKLWDILGYNYKSKVSDAVDFKAFSFDLRYPLLGGWKTTYSFNYYVPLYEYLYYEKPNKFVLKIRLLDHVRDNVTIEKITTKVILPEGAGRINFARSPGFRYVGVEHKQTFFGMRQIATFEGSNLRTDDISDDHLIQYEYHPLHIILMIFAIVLYLYEIFILIIIYQRWG